MTYEEAILIIAKKHYPNSDDSDTELIDSIMGAFKNVISEAAELYAESVKKEGAKDGFSKGTHYGFDVSYEVNHNRKPKLYEEALTEYLKTVKL